MATTITNDGIKLVKQEIPDVSFESPAKDQDVATKEPQQNQASLLTLSEVASNLHSAETSKTTDATEPAEEQLELESHSEVAEDGSLHDPGIQRVETKTKECDDEFDDDDDDDDEGNLMIDDMNDDNTITNGGSQNMKTHIVNSKENIVNPESTNNSNSGANVLDRTPSNDIITLEDEDEADDSSDKGEKEVTLEKLPRPVNELNCRQSRTYLVKLLRAANGGLNPHYGNPDMKPAFWPDYYWPWARLTDVHTKPRGMNEPLQYSEMMKLAIARGYQYFGYDPDTYFDPSVEKVPATGNPLGATTIVSNVENSGDITIIQRSIRHEGDGVVGQTSEGGSTAGMGMSTVSINDTSIPPKLPRPLSLVNCIQARTVLARLLRFQQGGNNPMYGSPETEPPWWPNNLIRWVDMVDLRGKPPYLPDGYTYTEVLKEAIGKCLRHNNCDPETYVDPELLNQPGMQRRHVMSSNINQTLAVAAPKSSTTAIFQTTQSIVSPPRVTIQPTFRNVPSSSGGQQTTPTISTIQQPISIPQMTRFVPIAPAPTATVPLVAQMSTANPISPQQITSSPIQIQIQPALPNQPQTTGNILKVAATAGQQRITLNTEPIIVQSAGKDGKQMVVGRREQIMLLQPSPISVAGGVTTMSSGLDDIAADIQDEHESRGKQTLISNNTNMQAHSGQTPDADEDEEDNPENLPPRLPLPIGRLNCSTTRTVLAKLIRFHCGNQLPNYGNPASMPCWWPNHLIDWTQIKNLSHKYEGYLGNTYSNCLRIAVIRGYAHYGLDANEYVEKAGIIPNGANFHVGRSSNNFPMLMERRKNQQNIAQLSEEEIVVEPAFYGNDEESMDSSLVQSDDEGEIRVEGSPVTAPVSLQNTAGGFQTVAGLDPRLPTEPLPPSVANCRQLAASASRRMGVIPSSSSSPKAPVLPPLKPISEIISANNAPPIPPATAPGMPLVHTGRANLKTDHANGNRSIIQSDDPKYPNFSADLLSKKRCFPPKLNCQRAICKPGVAKSLKNCKVVLEKMNTVISSSASLTFTNICRKSAIKDIVGIQKFVYEDMKTHNKFTDFFVQAEIGCKKRIAVHKMMLISHSPELKTLIEDTPFEGDSVMILCGVDYETLKFIIDAIYLGQVIVSGKGALGNLEDALDVLKPYGILSGLKRKPSIFPSWEIPL